MAVNVVAATDQAGPRSGNVRSAPATTIVAPGPKKNRSAAGPRMKRSKRADGTVAGAGARAPPSAEPDASRPGDPAMRGARTGGGMAMILSPQEAGET